MLAFGHTIIFHLRNCSQSIQTFHVFLRVVNLGLTMAMSPVYKLNQRCRVHTQKEENTQALCCSHCLCIVVGGIQHLNVKCGCYTYFIFTVTHFPPQAELFMVLQMWPLRIRKTGALCPHLSSTTVCPLLLVSSMMIFSSSGKSICTSFLLEPDETGTTV